jgi:HEAT repeat protein
MPTLIWVVSWSLCGLAGLVLCGLMIHRSSANRRELALELERARYLELLKSNAGFPAGQTGPADDVLTDVAVEILELVRGEEKHRFAERVSRAGVAAKLHGRLRRGSVRTRILAAAALANFADEKSEAALTAALHDPNREVRLAAAHSLAAGGRGPSLMDVALALGINEQDGSLRTVMLLSEMARSRIDDVRSLLSDARVSAGLRSLAALVLAKRGDLVSLPRVIALANDAAPDAGELSRYLQAIAEFGHPAAFAVVLRSLESPMAEVRAAAARAAGQIGTTSGLAGLERLLADADWWVRFDAARALVRLGEEGLARLRNAALGSVEPAGETARLTLAEAGRAT